MKNKRTLKDRLYKWSFKRSIKKYSQPVIKNLYFQTLSVIKSNKYNGYLLHKLILQKEVLQERLNVNYGID